MIPLLLAVPFGPVLAWKRGNLRQALEPALVGRRGGTARPPRVLALFGITAWVKAIAIGVAVWLMLGAIADPLSRVKAFSSPIGDTLRRLINLPRSSWGTTTAHFGLGVMLLGIVGVSAFQSEKSPRCDRAKPAALAGYEFTFEGLRPNTGENYSEVIAGFTVRKDGLVVTRMEPSRRIYPARNFPTTEAAFHTINRFSSQLYISLRRSRSQWRPGGADLSQAAGDVHLVRHRVDDDRRRVVAVGPALARRRAQPGPVQEGRRKDLRGGGMSAVLSLAARLVAMLLLALALAGPAAAVNPDEVLDDPALEERARALSLNLRCLVCQNQSIDDSNAELARDLRLLVRERLVAGDSDDDVIDYVVSRYGEFVLLKPRFSVQTLLLWGAPLLVFLAGAVVMVLYARGRERAVATESVAALSQDEQAELAKVLEDRDRQA
jgi:cytochrome c-type biogenesis protein CcmH